MFKFLFYKEPEYKNKLLGVEWASLCYLLFTLVLCIIFHSRIKDISGILEFRAIALALTAVLFLIYQKFPYRLVHYLRITLQFSFLTYWYPDIANFCTLFPYLDHIFANLDYRIFGCQASIIFFEKFNSRFFSELMCLAYMCYFPMIITVLSYYFIKRYKEFDRAALIVLGSFFIYYIVYIFLPVSGPQYYFFVVGVDQILNNNFINIGHYFATHFMEPHTPGYNGSLFYDALIHLHHSGERPIASFPSSHVGITSILLFLSLRTKNKYLIFSLLPVYICICMSTVYLRAHYLIDAIVGFLSAVVIYKTWVFFVFKGSKNY